MALSGRAEELHAQVALSVLAYVLGADSVAPAIREEAARAIAIGAETDLPTALLRAVQGHAYAVRAAALRDERNALLAALFVQAFQRILDVAGSNTTNWSGRVLDLAAAYDHRYLAAAPDGDPADLDEGIRLTEQVIEASAADPAALLRAHKLRAPMLMVRDELAPGADLQAGERSFQAIVDLSPLGDPMLADTKQRLAATRMLLSGRPPRQQAKVTEAYRRSTASRPVWCSMNLASARVVRGPGWSTARTGQRGRFGADRLLVEVPGQGGYFGGRIGGRAGSRSGLASDLRGAAFQEIECSGQHGLGALGCAGVDGELFHRVAEAVGLVGVGKEQGAVDVLEVDDVGDARAV